MTPEEIERISKEMAKVAHIHATPIDFDKLIKEGLLRKVGRSYYTDNIHGLPENVSKKIKALTNTKQGIRLTFHKESKSMIKLAERTKHLRD